MLGEATGGLAQATQGVSDPRTLGAQGSPGEPRGAGVGEPRTGLESFGSSGSARSLHPHLRRGVCGPRRLRSITRVSAAAGCSEHSEIMFSVAKGHPGAGPTELRPEKWGTGRATSQCGKPSRQGQAGAGSAQLHDWGWPDLQGWPGGWTEGPGRGLRVPGAPWAAPWAGAPPAGAGPAGLLPAGIWNTSTSRCSRGQQPGACKESRRDSRLPMRRAGEA